MWLKFCHFPYKMEEHSYCKVGCIKVEEKNVGCLKIEKERNIVKKKEMKKRESKSGKHELWQQMPIKGVTFKSNFLVNEVVIC